MLTYQERKARAKRNWDAAVEVVAQELERASPERIQALARFGARQLCMDAVAGYERLSDEETRVSMREKLQLWRPR